MSIVRGTIIAATVVVLGLGGALFSSSHTARVTATVVATFNPALGQLLEGVAVDRMGTIYFGTIGSGEIWKLAPQGSPTPFVRFSSGPVLGLKTDDDGNVYAATGANRNVWRVAPDGTTTRLASVPSAGTLNDLVVDRRLNVWVTDSDNGTIYRIGPDGTVTRWLDDPFLQKGPCPHPLSPAGNGIAFRGDDEEQLFVANTSQGSIVRIPVMDDGGPGAPSLVAGPTCDLAGADGIVFGRDGLLYVALNIQDRIVRIDVDDREDDIEVLATAADALRFPATLAFGLGVLDEEELFVANIGLRWACCWSQTGPPEPRLVKVHIDDLR